MTTGVQGQGGFNKTTLSDCISDEQKCSWKMLFPLDYANTINKCFWLKLFKINFSN